MMHVPGVEDVDFDEVYQGKPILGGMTLVPWDIGEPQPLLVELEAAGEIRGAVLDAGCGLADNSLFLASRGYQVTGIDGSSTAVETARRKAAERGLDAEFAVSDATRLDGFDDRFDTVLDSALYHCLSEEQQHEYAAALHRVCKPGATLHLFALSDRMGPMPPAMVVGEENLRGTFSKGWRITRLRRRTYTTRFTVQEFQRIKENDPEAAGGEAPDELPLDDQGRFLMPVWQLTAVRD